MKRSRGNDDARLLDRIEHGQRFDGDPVVVGRGQRQLVALESGQDSGQDGPGLIRCGSERHFAKSLPQNVLGDSSRRPFAGRGDRRELLGIEALYPRLKMARLDK